MLEKIYSEEEIEEATLAYNFEVYPEGDIYIFEENSGYTIDPEEQMEKLNNPDIDLESKG